MALQSKLTVYAALAGVIGGIGGFVYYASLDNEQLEQAEITLIAVELKDIDTLQNQAEFDVTFLVGNPSEKTFTVSLIAYQLYGDGELLGSGQYSTVDIALPGRAVFYTDSEVPLKSKFTASLSEENADIYDALISGSISEYVAEGTITTETSWSLVEKEFRTEL